MISSLKGIYERVKFNTPTSQVYELVNRGIKSNFFKTKKNGGLTVLLIPLGIRERKLRQHEIDLTNEEFRSGYRLGRDFFFVFYFFLLYRYIIQTVLTLLA